MTHRSARGWHARRNTGSTTRWRKIRLFVLSRDSWQCQINGPRCTGTATQVDHILSLADGGTDDPQNLRAACVPCNAGRRDGLPAPDHGTQIEVRTRW